MWLADARFVRRVGWALRTNEEAPNYETALLVRATGKAKELCRCRTPSTTEGFVLSSFSFLLSARPSFPFCLHLVIAALFHSHSYLLFRSLCEFNNPPTPEGACSL
jgi:hypothetical protein